MACRRSSGSAREQRCSDPTEVDAPTALRLIALFQCFMEYACTCHTCTVRAGMITLLGDYWATLARKRKARLLAQAYSESPASRRPVKHMVRVPPWVCLIESVTVCPCRLRLRARIPRPPRQMLVVTPVRRLLQPRHHWIELNEYINIANSLKKSTH